MRVEEEREARRQQTTRTEALAHLSAGPLAGAKSHLPAGDGGGEGRGGG